MLRLHQRFGRTVRFLRESSGMSQERFAVKAGIDRRYYAKIEHGNANATLNIVEKVAVALSIGIAELFQHVEKYTDGRKPVTSAQSLNEALPPETRYE